MPHKLSTLLLLLEEYALGMGGGGGGPQFLALCVKLLKYRSHHKNGFIKVHLFNKLLLLVLPDDSDVHAYLWIK